MAIDADLNAGLINDEEAKRRRREVGGGSRLLRSMDGASKFVKGDAIAAIVIVAINLVGGSRSASCNSTCHSRSDQDVQPAHRRDGLVAQSRRCSSRSRPVSSHPGGRDGPRFPTCCTSSPGTRRRSSSAAARSARSRSSRVSLKIPFFIVGGAAAPVGNRLPSDARSKRARRRQEVRSHPSRCRRTRPERLVGEMRVEPLELEIAYDLIDLVDPAKAATCSTACARSAQARARARRGHPARADARQPRAAASTYAVRVNGVDVGRGEAPRVTSSSRRRRGLAPGTRRANPSSGFPHVGAIEFRHQAEITGATVVDRASVITTHLPRSCAATRAGSSAAKT